MRTCRVCNIEKLDNEFSPVRNFPERKRYICRLCTRDQRRAYLLKRAHQTDKIVYKGELKEPIQLTGSQQRIIEIRQYWDYLLSTLEFSTNETCKFVAEQVQNCDNILYDMIDGLAWRGKEGMPFEMADANYQKSGLIPSTPTQEIDDE